MPLGTEQELDLRALGAALPGVVRRALAIESLELG